MRGRIVMFTGLLGVVGGLSTIAVGSSCDVQCVYDPRPGVVVVLKAPDGSTVGMPEGGELWYTLETAPSSDAFDEGMTTEPQRRRARCLDRACSTWGLGYDQPGHYAVEATVCGERVSMEVDVELGEDGCHVDTVTVPLQIDPRACDDQPMQTPTGPTCDLMARPSVHVMVAREYDDYFMPVPVERVWFQYRERTEDALCVLDADGTCRIWLAGFELEGELKVFTEYCDTEVSATVQVPMDPTGCHVETQYLVLPVSTRGCLTEEDEPAPPKPRWPAPHEAEYG